ncbi:hypothetical protein SUGI_0232810 [Cryptomeria japonica]|uniref:SKP1-like protein 1B n=1 Tax=Cryptomeria japonica TaxID=3369 RepID=UPI002408E788|nr:SKP1-like protein 1B [Cryptomeria japonica]GLJ14409.1 hypothetical protein SUGI_0232810 [Cryptomeria japonica]
MEGKVILRSSDNQNFEVDEVVAMESQTIRDLIQLAGNTSTSQPAISLANVSSDILAMVIEYCKYHVHAKKLDSGISAEDVKKCDKELVAVDRNTVLKLLMAANYLNINGLVELTCQALADDIASCKGADDIRQKYNIKNDLEED